MEGTFYYRSLFDSTGIFIGILGYFWKYASTGQLGDNGNANDFQLPIIYLWAPHCILHFSMASSLKPVKMPGIK